VRNEPSVFDNYPAWMIVLSAGLSVSIYTLGIAVVSGMGWWILTPYLLFLLSLDVNQLARGCVHCAYYGRACFSGKGLAASWFFKRGDPTRFGCRGMTWLSLLPDMLVVLLPLGFGLFQVIGRFDWVPLPLMAGLLALAFPGNGFVRSRLACCHCRQRQLGCPAEKFFRPQEGSEPAATN
jgi:hypothetical protein